MLFAFGAMHAIAAKRGDGLRPELLDLLKRARATAEVETKSSLHFPDQEKTESDAEAILDSVE